MTQTNSELQKLLPSGFECTLTAESNRWIVDMWNRNGENHWSKRFKTYDEAKVEYDRWD